jgi:hypothetical protein
VYGLCFLARWTPEWELFKQRITFQLHGFQKHISHGIPDILGASNPLYRLCSPVAAACATTGQNSIHQSPVNDRGRLAYEILRQPQVGNAEAIATFGTLHLLEARKIMADTSLQLTLREGRPRRNCRNWLAGWLSAIPAAE